MSDAHLLILCTCPDRESAEDIAERLVAARLAACVNIVPGLTSVYRWQGAVERSDELLLLIKTHTDQYALLEGTLREAHPYDLPEIIALPIAAGLPAYLSWIDQNLGTDP